MRSASIGLLLLCVFASGTCVLAAESVVINALPETRVVSGPGAAQRESLSEAQRHEFRLLVTKVGDRYYWATRDNHEMDRARSGIYDIFIDRQGAGWVVVVDTRLVSDDSESDLSIQYAEHVRRGRGVISYYGEVSDYAP